VPASYRTPSPILRFSENGGLSGTSDRLYEWKPLNRSRHSWHEHAASFARDLLIHCDYWSVNNRWGSNRSEKSDIDQTSCINISEPKTSNRDQESDSRLPGVECVHFIHFDGDYYCPSACRGNIATDIRLTKSVNSVTHDMIEYSSPSLGIDQSATRRTILMKSIRPGSCGTN
jgi:hypothetical protein